MKLIIYMKYICYLSILLIFTGCALNPKPLTFSEPAVAKSPETIVKSPYLQIVYPGAIKQKKLVSRSYFTGIANTLNVELGQNINDVITKQASLYFDKVDVVESISGSSAGTPRIEIVSLDGVIGDTDLSLSGEMRIDVTDNSIQKIQQSISFAGEGSATVMLLGPLVAQETLTKAEHMAMQEIIDQLTSIMKKIHTDVMVAQQKSVQPQLKPAKKKTKTEEEVQFSQLGTFHALVIGNTKYPHLPDLVSAGHDAQVIAKVLKSEYGFSVKNLLNASRADIIHALSAYRKQLTENDNLLIYYAGHGWLDQEADEGYWLPVDADAENSVNWISNASITTALRAMPAKHIIVVADSCYSGKLTRGLEIQQRSPSFLDSMYKKKARVVLSSGGLEPVIDSGGTDNHSVFASAFINLLKENPDYLDGMTLFSNLRKQVAWNADQVPEYGIIHNAGHDGGDFIFQKKLK